MPMGRRHGARRYASLAVSVCLVVGMSAVGVVAARHLSSEALDGHREDAVRLQRTLSQLTDLANLVMADRMLNELAHAGAWSPEPGAARTAQQLEAVVRSYPSLNAGALVVDSTGLPLSTYAPGGALPDATDPGWEPLRAAALRGDGSLPVSGVLTTGARPAVAVGVPVDFEDGTRGLFIGLWALADSDLQRYTKPLTTGGSHQGFVVDGRGVVISSTVPETLGRPMPFPQTAAALASAGDSGVVETVHEGEPMLAVQAAVGTSGWRGLSVMTRSDFEGGLVRSSRAVQASVVALLLIAGGFLVVFHRRRERALEDVALRDELTGLYNRRGWFVLAEHELERARRAGTSRVLLFVDLDGLKRVNDALGHREGDRAIVDAAHVLEAATRSSDLVGRLGGDEFVVLLGDDGRPDVGRRRILEALHGHNARSHAAYELRLSVGAEVWFPEHAWDLDELVRRADAEMYADKVARPGRHDGVIRLPAPRDAEQAAAEAGVRS